jgi:DNA-binding GntR family transcriptional regulator
VEQQTDKPTSYGEQVTNRLRELILGGEYEPEQQLKEVELAERLGVSRSPIKIALTMLASEGLVTIVPHRGAVAVKFTPDRAIELYELRDAIECKSVELASERGSLEEIDRLAETLDRAQAEARDSSAYPAEHDFHMPIVLMTGNRQLITVARNLLAQTQLARSRSSSAPGRAAHALIEHQEILEKIRNRDAAGAVAAMRAHLQRSRENVLELLGNEQGPGPARS